MMPDNLNEAVIIDQFDLPESLAHELSDLLTRQTIRERLLIQTIGDPQKFEEIEKKLIPITAKIEAIKLKITKECVPEKYRFQQYQWSYDGFEVAGCKANIISIG